MNLIDDQGRLFGLVNVIDALAVLFVAAVVIAGVTFILQPEPEPPASLETATVTATVDLGVQPDYLVKRISAGDSYSPNSNSNLTVTEVYLAPQSDGARTFLAVSLEGIVSGETIAYDGAPPRLGRELALRTDRYQVSGTIRTVGSDLTTGTTQVLLEDTVDASTARSIEPGDTYSLAGHEVAAVESVEIYRTRNPDVRRVFLGLSLSTVRFGDGPQLGTTVMRPGAVVPFQTTEYSLTGTVRRVGATELEGEPATRTVTLELTNVRPELANTLRAGLTETAGAETIATMTGVETSPAIVVLASRNGEIYLREHPENLDVTLTAELAVRETATGPTFKGRPLRQGNSVVLYLGNTTIEATVVST